MIELLTRYWITFDFDNYSGNLPWYTKLGYGVTAFDLPDALGILDQTVFKGHALPTVLEIKEHVKMADLEQNHVLPNINVLPFKRGVWYPGGFEFIR